MIAVDSVTATLLEGAGVELGETAASIEMDEGWAPYVQGSLTLPIPADDTLEALDPRTPRRVAVDVSLEYPLSFKPPASRRFELGLRSRAIDHERGLVRLSLASDEALLMDDVLLDAAPRDYWAQRASLRAIINAVLARHGAVLEAGAADADMTPYWNVTNLMPNPSAETNTASWAPGGNSTVPTSTVLASPAPPLGTRTIRWTAAAAGTAFMVAGHDGTGYRVARVSPGRVYTASLHTVQTGTARPTSIDLRYFAEDGLTLLQTTQSAVKTGSQTVQTRHTVSAEAPVGAAYAAIMIRVEQCTAGQVLWADAAMIHEGGRAVDVFDGSTADTAAYNYEWSGAAHASTSSRTALEPRDPDSLVWQPGTSAWDFLQPLFQSVGLRLYADEARRWRLVDGATFVAAGGVQLTMPGNLYAASDVTERDGEGEWFDAAIARYEWTDAAGIRRERLDIHKPAGYSKVRVFEFTTAYPGAGFAAYAVKRAEGRGRVVELDAGIELAVTPSQPLTAILPGTPTLVGLVRAVTFDFSAGRMSVSSRGLTDVPAGAYVLAADGMTYSGAPAGVTYSAWTNPNGA
jgi:hypothetical protein